MCQNPLDPRCKPLKWFVDCPPLGPIDPEALGIPYRGVALLERPDGSGIVDVYDWIGSEHYPNVLDMFYEIGNLGLSRRAPTNLDYSNLTRQSRICLIHERAFVTNRNACYDALAEEADHYDPDALEPWKCPRDRPEHDEDRIWPIGSVRGATGRPMCAALWDEMVEGGDPIHDTNKAPRTIRRQVGATSYEARRWFDKHDPVPQVKPEFAPGIFMRLPLQRFEVVSGDTAKEAKAHKAASVSGLPVATVAE